MSPFQEQIDKTIKEQENGTIITNPKEPFRTFFRKMAYRFAVWKDRLSRLFTHSKGGHQR